MIISLELEYFAQHTHQTFVFTEGLNTIRGANEAGKSNLLLSIAYALFGARVLPMSLDDTVSWGFPTKNLKVTLTMSLDGKLYLFTRSAAGAECQHTGGIVTGQKEVAKFAADLLGADAERAAKMMIAKQGSLCGALEDGPTALASYIESVSGMDLFDRLLESAASRWVLGPTTSIDSDIAVLKEKLSGGEPAKPDCTECNSQIADLQRRNDFERKRINVELLPAVRKAEEAYVDGLTAAEARKHAINALKRTRADYEEKRQQYDAACAIVGQPVDEQLIGRLESNIKLANDLQMLKQARKKYIDLPVNGTVWEGDYDSMMHELEKQIKDERTATNNVHELESRIRELQAQKVVSSVCGFCDQDMSLFPAVAKKNAEIDEQCKQIGIELDANRLTKQIAHDQVVTLRKLKDDDNEVSNFYARYHAYVEKDSSVVPSRLKWTATLPCDEMDVQELERELKALVDRKRKHEKAVMLKETLEPQLAELLAGIQVMESSIPPEVDIDMLKQARDEAASRVKHYEDEISECNVRIQRLESAIQRVIYQYDRDYDEWQSAQIKLARLHEDRKQLIFHNGIVKKIKSARPLVAAKLWEVVLASTSNMFTMIRGEPSVVTRTDKEFLVNGKTINGLSGSAKDVLGLALRVSLLKSFIPDCPFLILDEPMSACDDERSKSLLSFVNCCGFSQVILVTHEEMSADWASNLIRI